MKEAPGVTAWLFLMSQGWGRLMLVDMAGSESIEQAVQIGFEAKMQLGSFWRWLRMPLETMLLQPNGSRPMDPYSRLKAFCMEKGGLVGLGPSYFIILPTLTGNYLGKMVSMLQDSAKILLLSTNTTNCEPEKR